MTPLLGEGWTEEFIDGSLEKEHHHFETFARQIQQVQAQSRKTGQTLNRALHAKIHLGVTNAQFIIHPQLPPEFQHGIFQPGRVYDAALRLSNAATLVQPDHAKDLRGLGVRVFLSSTLEQVSGQVNNGQVNNGQFIDLLMTNAPASHARNAEQFMATVLAATGSKLLIPLRLLFAFGIGETCRILKTLRRDRRTIQSLATETFWSRGPFQLGPKAIQFFAQPSQQNPGDNPPANHSDPNFLRADIQARLRRGPLIYELYAQPFICEKKTPIEDGAKRWEPRDSTPIPIAQLVIPQQELTTTSALDAEEFVQSMGFNPWQSAGAELLKPLGGLNRARKPVYKASAAFREEGSSASSQSRCPLFKLGAGIVGFVERGLAATNRFIAWSDWAKLNPYLGVLNLIHVRRVLRAKNLHDTESLASREFYEQQYPSGGGCPVFKLAHRTADGSFNDLSNSHMGRSGTRFGRNITLDHAQQEQLEQSLLTPNPRLIAQTLMTRQTFKPVLQLNLLAAAWIQFMIHGWIFHEADDTQKISIEVQPQDQDWTGPRPMQVSATKVDPRSAQDPERYPKTFLNRESHWWDGSQIYGSSQAIQDQVRSHQGGKLHIDDRGLLPARPFDPSAHEYEINALETTGLTENWWLGMGLMHSLFTLEHNAICDRLSLHYPSWGDEQLFQTARLVNAALLAKIHTVEWTAAILNHPTLKISLNTNWWGLFGERFYDLFSGLSSNEVLHGIPGSPKELSGVPYSLTEEFTSVYRLHPLLPDDLVFHSIQDGRRIENFQWPWMEQPQSSASLGDVVGPKARIFMENLELSDLLYSFGLMHPGEIALDNYPNFLRTLNHNGNVVDLAAVEIFRDRERGVPRYNEFRRQLHLKPAASFLALVGGDEAAAAKLAQVYDDIEAVDLLVGLLAERPLPKGFGFSDTAFRLFILMAARRLNCDRFFTTDYTPETYTPVGMQWVQDNTMSTVLLRHFPQLTPALRHVENAFAPWNRVGESN